MPGVVGDLISRTLHGQWVFNPYVLADVLHLDLANVYLVFNDGVRNVVIAVVVLEFSDYMRRRSGREFVLTMAPVWLRWTCYYALACAIWILAPFGSKQFIYFQF